MPTRAQLRRLAACVLLLWLFGLASGVVNACVVASGLRHAAHAAALEAAQDHAGHGMGGSLHAAGADHDPDDGKPPCERLCEEPAAPVQADKQQSTPLSGFWLAAMPLPSLAHWPAIGQKAPVPRDEFVSRTAIPIPIAYLRLTL